jgi:Protein of unknown function (DUF4231)
MWGTIANMPKSSYRDYLKQSFTDLIDRLDIADLRKDFLKQRWLDQVLWLEGRAKKEQKQHYTLRLITIIGGVLVPALVGFRSPDNARMQTIIAGAAFGVSQIVAISAAIEEFFGHGERYRTYRNTAEGLKIEAWQFFQLTGPYKAFPNHEDAYTYFSQRVELFIRQDVEGFLAQVENQPAVNKDQVTHEAPDDSINMAANMTAMDANSLETILKSLMAQQQDLQARLEALTGEGSLRSQLENQPIPTEDTASDNSP